ncbi:MAG: SPOR domain-containing protein [Gammaproteobacteria bacterium]
MKIDNKQKVLITLIVIALAYVLWQVYNQFFRETSAPAPAAVSAPPAPTPTPAQLAPTEGATPAQQPSAAPSPPSGVQPAPKNAIPAEGGFTLEAPMSEYQNQYLELVNQYQLLRMQRMIEDEKANIASAEARIADINKKISGVAGGPSVTSEMVTGNAANPTGYKLMYIDFQSGQWSATLGKEGRFLEVNIGDILIDGTRVLSINQQGVVVEQNQHQYLLTFFGTKNLGQVKPIELDNTLAPNNLFIPSSKGSKPKMATPTPMISPPSIKASLAPPVEKATETKVVTPLTKPAGKAAETKVVKPVNKVAPPVPTVSLPVVPPSKPTTVPTIPKKNAPTPSSPAVQMPVIPTKPAPQQNKSSSSLPPVPGTMNNLKIQPPLRAPETASVAIPMKITAASPPPAPVPAPTAALKLTAEQKNTYNALQSMFGDSKPESSAESPEKMQQAITPDTNSPLSFSQDEKYLLTVPGNYYVVQIMGSTNLNDLTRLLRQYHLNDQARGFQTQRLDQNWYVLVYGVYKNNQDATNALTQLPAGIQQLKPWVRSVASIHDAIRLRRDNPGKQVSHRQDNHGIQM